MNNPCPLPRGARLTGYFRDSGGARQEQSVAQQNGIYDHYVSDNGLVDVGVFKDLARPGSSVVGRDNFDKLIAYLEQKPRPCDGVALWNSARFSRNQDDSKYYKSKIRRMGYIIIYLSGEVPDMGRFTPLAESMIEFADEEFLKKLSAEVVRGINTAFEAGHWQGKVMPGYKTEQIQWDTHRDGTPRYMRKISIDPETKGKAYKAFELRASGASYRTLYQETGLYQGQVRHAAGSFKVMLGNPIYMGKRRWKGVLYDVPELAIVPEALWHQVQQVNEERGAIKKAAPRQLSSPYLLSGLVFCTCGAAMHGHHYTQKQYGLEYNYYHCCVNCGKPYHDQETLERAIVERVINDILEKDKVRFRVEEENARRKNSNSSIHDRLAEEKRRVKALTQEINNIADSLKLAALSPVLANRLSTCETELNNAQAIVKRLEAEQATPIDVKDALVTAETIRERIKGLDVEIARASLKKLILRIEVDGKNAKILYSALSL